MSKAMSSLKDKYTSEVVPALEEELGIRNRMGVPRLQKVVVNMGVGVVDKDVLKALTDDLGTITGQRPQLRKAKNSISNFKLREGMVVGARVTLRRERMFEFLDRLINAGLPGIRDFRGLSPKAFDGRGNYSLGIREQSIFPEIDPNDVKESQGLNVTIVTTARDDEVAKRLLELLGMPFASA